MTIESMIRQDTVAPKQCELPGVAVAVTDLAHGRTVVLEKNNQVILMFAAATATARQTAFCIRHSSGFLQVALPPHSCDRLLIPEIPVFHSTAPQSTRQCVAVDAVGGTTGISATDRARTARVLGQPDSNHLDITRPGHMVVLKVDDQPATTSIVHAAMALCELATGTRATMFAELVSPNDQRRMADRGEAEQFAQIHGLNFLHLAV
ncbi:3,4-dihydroxy-2-butanone-4-phosphate synthase [Rhodococcus qingshengii]|uniref:3,4-dihydroxy-2-butanone-4-phosphate synthase n=1 Tax=Rhodococcus qingshengii TaxID=334542 RepID=UPI001E3459A9|nr:3,4-dihydroxy-2-butanone-4-phosphate synthase [Rhodococcus qingshengii]MCQ4150575.1 3,4-dihydroxy-2-butanone-4-phosphate synthase [Rhodococcus qingshengii]UGQ55437.1 3,4-dihydroxy-2-butanone-4-phosphate synthase [Rhodococcus qingshengii]